ncbi:MAG TPA: OmpA family protein [Vicinamibacterales bacterium]|nr:OmpA family protein [Vicinamibacterales bacterium]
MRNVYALAVLGLTVALAPACATKKHVRTEVGSVNAKVDTLAGSLEQTQERTRQNESRIAAVDVKAEAAGRSAAEAGTAATAAATNAASATREVDGRLTGRINQAEASARRLIYEVALTEDEGNFTFGDAALPDEAKARLDEMVAQLKADPKGVFIEVEGHTDNVGKSEYNEQLGLERAETVKRYLYMQHQVPLHKINVVSYGEEKPVAPNNTRTGRAQNRRVVVRVLS